MASSPDSTLKRLRISRIPTEENNMSILNDYFKKFGTITNIAIGYGNPQTALVAFSTRDMAEAALNCTDHVLGNENITKQWDNQAAKLKRKSASSSSSTPSKNPNDIQCSKCDKVFATKQSLQNHTRRLHTRVKCPACSEIFESPNDWRKHFNDHHTDSKSFVFNPSDESKEFFRQSNNDYMRWNDMVSSLRRTNESLEQKVREHEKKKLEAAELLKRLLTGQYKNLFNKF